MLLLPATPCNGSFDAFANLQIFSLGRESIYGKEFFRAVNFKSENCQAGRNRFP